MYITLKEIASPGGILLPMPHPNDTYKRNEMIGYMAERIAENLRKGVTVVDYDGKRMTPEYIKNTADASGDQYDAVIESEALMTSREYWLNDWHTVTMASPKDPALFIEGQKDCKDNKKPKSDDESYLSGWGMQYELQEIMSNAS